MTSNPDLDTGPSTELCTTTTPATPTAPPRSDRVPGMHWSFRADRRVIWVGYHSPELVGVLGPAALVVIWDAPALVLVVSGVVAGLWGAHEARKRRQRDKSADARPGALTPDQAAGTQSTTSDEEATRGHMA